MTENAVAPRRGMGGALLASAIGLWAWAGYWAYNLADIFPSLPAGEATGFFAISVITFSWSAGVSVLLMATRKEIVRPTGRKRPALRGWLLTCSIIAWAFAAVMAYATVAEGPGEDLRGWAIVAFILWWCAGATTTMMVAKSALRKNALAAQPPAP